MWSTDITYARLAGGFAYLVAIIDWYSRKVLSWRLSNSMDATFCVDCLEDALKQYGQPEVFNSDQGSQGEFNRSSQHWIVEQILETCPVLRRVFSSQVFFEA